MKKASAEILCVGTELLIGDIINTNAAFISKRLASLGIPCYRQSVVGDNPGRLAAALDECFSRCDLLIMSGGLGPTYDDLTKETVAAHLGRELVYDDATLLEIEAFFKRRGVRMTENNRKQSLVPKGAVVFPNDRGTAPGLAVTDNSGEKTVILLPGPPNELEPMFDRCVLPFLMRFSDEVFASRNINICGMGESAVEDVLRPLMLASDNPTVAPYCNSGEVRLRITACAKNESNAYSLCDEMIEKIRKTSVGAYIYGIDTTLEEALVDALRRHNLTLATAESCTGGLLSKRLTDVSGSSAVFPGGVVSYSNEIKTKLLNVSRETLKKHGAVSTEVACQMAKGAAEALSADIGVGITGIAGPTGAEKDKPVGLVHIAVFYKGDVTEKACRFSGIRSRIRLLATNEAMTSVLDRLR